MKSKARSKGAGGGIVVEATKRKARRKEKRHAKKKQNHQSLSASPSGSDHAADDGAKPKKIRNKADADGIGERSNKRVKFSNAVQETTIPHVKNPIPTGLKSSKSHSSSSLSKSSTVTNKYYYNDLDDETAAALRKDDIEIEYLESNLGINPNRRRGRRELNREYAKNEGFGDDFGDFLTGLDDLAERCVGGDDDVDSDGGGNDDEDSDGDVSNRDNEGDYGGGLKRSDSPTHSEEEEEGSVDGGDPYAHLDEETALAFRNDDAEIAQLEQKLGLANSSKAKKKLNKEFSSTFQGYGEDFGDFLDGLDQLGGRVGMMGGSNEEDDSSRNDGSMGSDDSCEGKYPNDDESNDSEAEDIVEDADHDVALTYRPTSGEDIYGNKIDNSRHDSAKPRKYIPPHLRKKDDEEVVAPKDGENNPKEPSTSSAITADPETIKLIQRSLNNTLNRLSEQTLESVSKSIASLYSQFPFHDLNDCLWKNIKMACVPPHMVMSGMIPLYVGAMAGVHWLGGDGIQLGGCLVEWSVKKLFDSLERGRKMGGVEGGEHDAINKEASNLLLIACYLYNYGVIHCTLIYDLVRDTIKCFKEIDVESLLIILSHCGQQLRSDDPSSLKEIVLLVKDRIQKAVESANDSQNAADSSRVQYMVDTILGLKNNKPRKQSLAVREKTNAMRKCIGRIKSSVSRPLGGKKSGSCLRVTLRDVLDADTKGRWWTTGASWVGNQHHEKLWGENDAVEPQTLRSIELTHGESSLAAKKASSEDGLLSLASSQRMNTDARRSIFCIVMGSSDCDDAFEKLVRQGMLKIKVERDVVRVIVHCCGEEKAFNPFYAYLALRVCEFQQKSKFTLMLTFWDAFKQLESFPVRKVANLAKLLAHLIGSGDKCLTIGVLKRIDFSPSDMSERVIVFLSIFMTALFEFCDVEKIRKIFGHGSSSCSAPGSHLGDSDEDDGTDKAQKTRKDDLSDLYESVSVFLLQYLKPSPKNIEGSTFHSNLTSAIESCEKVEFTP